MPVIECLDALEILDSRGRPTVLTTCTLEGNVRAAASVPSGASTGTAEALELRDGDASRYGGLGCRKAVRNIVDVILPRLRGVAFESQQQLDRALLDLDGTANKSRLGANAILAISIAFARACAAAKDTPLYQQFASMLGTPARTLPRLTINLFSGGKHAGGQMPIQDVLVVPVAAKTVDEGLAHTYAVYQAAAKLSVQKYNTRPLKADEGGLAPPFESAESALADAVQCIRDAGFTPGKDVALAVDVASTHFYEHGRYHLGNEALDSRGMISRLSSWLDAFPIISLEDGLSEEDWQYWPELRERVGERALVLGDDFLCTNPGRIRRAIESKAANALLLKVNQIGTLTEAAESYRIAKSAGWHVTVSARSGETEDNWLADLAVGWNGDHIKIGSITQSERLAKYNRLLQIESETKLSVIPL